MKAEENTAHKEEAYASSLTVVTVEGSDEFHDCCEGGVDVAVFELITFWRVKVLFQVPHDPLAPLWVARL
jgi:hypothetical protein